MKNKELIAALQGLDPDDTALVEITNLDMTGEVTGFLAETGEILVEANDPDHPGELAEDEMPRNCT